MHKHREKSIENIYQMLVVLDTWRKEGALVKNKDIRNAFNQGAAAAEVIRTVIKKDTRKYGQALPIVFNKEVSDTPLRILAADIAERVSKYTTKVQERSVKKRKGAAAKKITPHAATPVIEKVVLAEPVKKSLWAKIKSIF